MSNLSFTQEQRTLEWYRARLGYITGSQVGSLMKSGRTKDKVFSDTALTYLYQLAGERSLNPEIVKDDNMFTFYLEQTTSQSKAMRFGSEQEPNARALYAEINAEKGYKVSEVGLCHHKTLKNLASSPDGIVNYVDENSLEILGCLEIKCPGLAAYTQYVAEIYDNASLLAVQKDYFYQCQCHMACTGAMFCDFIVYCPFVENPIHIVRITRDEEVIAEIEERVRLAEEIINDNYQQLKRAKI